VTSSSGLEEGDLHLAVYDSENGFATQQTLFSLIQPCSGEPIGIEITLPAPGAYVLAAFHDRNNNGRLDTNLFGVPTEPYGFAETPPSKYRSPVFSEIATPFAGGKISARIDLKTWKEY
jgi:uncharacterized protein (DUF2141 family)